MGCIGWNSGTSLDWSEEEGLVLDERIIDLKGRCGGWTQEGLEIKD